MVPNDAYRSTAPRPMNDSAPSPLTAALRSPPLPTIFTGPESEAGPMSFQCTVVTPEQQALDEPAEQVVLPAHDGQIGILPGRAPLLVKLGVGPLRVDLAGGERRFFLVDGGVAQMRDDKLTVLTQVATPADQIDVPAAQADGAKAEAEHPTDPVAQADRRRRMDRARAAEAVAAMR